MSEFLKDELQQLREKREAERAHWSAVNARAKLKAQGKESATEYGQALFQDNAEQVTVALGLLLEELLVNPSKPGPHFAAWPLLLHVTNRGPRSLASIALGVVIDYISQRPTQKRLAGAIGTALQDELKAGRIEEISPDLVRLIRKRRGVREISKDRVLKELKLDTNGWTLGDKREVGNLLLQIIDANSNLLRITKTTHNGRVRTVVHPSDEALKAIENNPPKPLPTRQPPMLIQPRPWLSMYGGGHLDNDLPLIRSRTGMNLDFLNESNLSPVIRSVNYLQAQELTIDSWMVDIQRTAWDSNIRGLFPVVRDPIEDPIRPEGFMEDNAYKKWREQKLLAQRDRAEGSAERRHIEQSLRDSSEVTDESVYFSYCADFRYRIYSSNRYATHQGPDWEKAAISFEEKENAGNEGFGWMLKAAANHYGVKGTWEEKEKWGVGKLAEICSIVESPLDRLELWRDAKDPWQYLQLAKAISDWMGGDLKTGVPIRLDQTCSGIGIASCLLRDRRLAKLTNITGEKPLDLYLHIADRLTHLLEMDLHNGSKMEQKQAQFWLGIGIDRSLCKGPCMTTIYGAQFLGIVDSLVSFLEDKQQGLSIGQWEYAYLMPARYLARKIGLLLGAELKSCIQLQTWLRGMSKKVLSKGDYIEWTNPMGTPIRLGEKHDARTTVNTLTRGKRRWLKWNDQAAGKDELSARTTNRSITANLCHSFDASLCQMQILRAEALGYPLLTNHDCFATRPDTAGWMQMSLLHELRELYSVDWLDEIRAEIIDKTGIKDIEAAPRVGDLCFGEIGSNDNCFS